MNRTRTTPAGVRNRLRGAVTGSFCRVLIVTSARCDLCTFVKWERKLLFRRRSSVRRSGIRSAEGAVEPGENGLEFGHTVRTWRARRPGIECRLRIAGRLADLVGIGRSATGRGRVRGR